MISLLSAIFTDPDNYETCNNHTNFFNCIAQDDFGDNVKRFQTIPVITVYPDASKIEMRDGKSGLLFASNIKIRVVG